MDAKDFIVSKVFATPEELKFISVSLAIYPYQQSETKTPDGATIPDSDRTNSSLRITGEVGLNIIDMMIFGLFSEAIQEYAAKFPKMTITSDQGYHALKYEVGEEYKAHVDAGPSENRIVSGILYLNDDYEGGELVFPELGVTIKPKAGELVLFPSNYCYVHQSMPITKGTKHAVVTWFV